MSAYARITVHLEELRRKNSDLTHLLCARRKVDARHTCRVTFKLKLIPLDFVTFPFNWRQLKAMQLLWLLR